MTRFEACRRMNVLVQHAYSKKFWDHIAKLQRIPTDVYMIVIKNKLQNCHLYFLKSNIHWRLWKTSPMPYHVYEVKKIDNM